jgi:hypothetical protein
VEYAELMGGMSRQWSKGSGSVLHSYRQCHRLTRLPVANSQVLKLECMLNEGKVEFIIFMQRTLYYKTASIYQMRNHFHVQTYISVLPVEMTRYVFNEAISANGSNWDLADISSRAVRGM